MKEIYLEIYRKQNISRFIGRAGVGAQKNTSAFNSSVAKPKQVVLLIINSFLKKASFQQNAREQIRNSQYKFSRDLLLF